MSHRPHLSALKPRSAASVPPVPPPQGRLHWRWVVDGLSAEIGLGGLHDLEDQVERDLVGERQRSNRHAGHLGGVLDHRRRHTFEQHFQPFGGEPQHAAIGEEAARVVDHDRRLADRANEIERGGKCDIAGFLADDDLDQHHALDW